MIFFLVGMPASGKSTLGRQLAEILNGTFTDLDDYISEQENLSITDFFAKQGESVFRQVESYHLKNMDYQENHIIATGGGTPCFVDNLAFMKEKGKVIYLDVPLEILTQRIIKKKGQRPLFQGKTPTETEQIVAVLFKKRLPFYQKSDVIMQEQAWNDPQKTLQQLLEITSESKI
jgi:shikimate kinase